MISTTMITTRWSTRTTIIIINSRNSATQMISERETTVIKTTLITLERMAKIITHQLRIIMQHNSRRDRKRQRKRTQRVIRRSLPQIIILIRTSSYPSKDPILSP